MYFSVKFSNFSSRHYCKSFEKKYKGASWNVTKDSIESILERFENSRKLADMSILNENESMILGKLRFKIAGANSGSRDGGRLVFIADIENRSIEIALVYEKSHIGMKGKETVWIHKLLEENFPDTYF